MLKDYMGVPERTYDINLDVEYLIRESGIVLDKICLANKICGVIQEDENISYETALALILPLYDYDSEYLKTESSLRDDIAQNMAVSQSFSIKIMEVIKKLFRVFYNIFPY